jgi:calcineurin-like phosphoesterase family protein
MTYNITIKEKEKMKQHLYPIFVEKWYHNGSLYFYSDPHFGDPEMPFIRKDYISDDEQVKRINSKVSKRDTIIFLGDIGDIEYIKKIKGYKVLVCGNHDRGGSYYQEVFDEVYSGPLMISDRILLSHEPIALPYVFNIHGHDHSNSEKVAPHHFNMCAEHINYTPVSLKEILKSGIMKEVPDIHRYTIDKKGK